MGDSNCDLFLICDINDCTVPNEVVRNILR